MYYPECVCVSGMCGQRLVCVCMSGVILALLVHTHFHSIHLSLVILCGALRFWTRKGRLQGVHNGIHHNLRKNTHMHCISNPLWTGTSLPSDSCVYNVITSLHHNGIIVITRHIKMFSLWSELLFSCTTMKCPGSNLVYSWHYERFLDKGNPGICVESQELLHLLTIGYFRDGTELLKKSTEYWPITFEI